jgi:DNA-binding NtrC family response regulator
MIHGQRPLGTPVALQGGVENVFTIVIADRNPHVRRFLQRELARGGYRIHLVENARELYSRVSGPDPVNLVILDPDLPDAAPFSVVEALGRRLPRTPVVIHTHAPHAAACSPENRPCHSFVVEKSGGSVERLKQVAAALFEDHRAEW